MMRLKAAFCFLLFCIAFKAPALTAFVGHTYFYVPKASSFSPYVEVYSEVDPNSLHFENKDGNWETRIRVDVRFSNDTGVFSEDHFVLQTAPIPDQAQALRQGILDLHRYPLVPGLIKMRVSFTEIDHAENTYTYTDSFAVAELKGTGISQLQIIDTAIRTKGQGTFVRNNMQQIPLSLPFLDDRKGALNYYFEMYGLDKVKDEGPLVQSVFISKKEGGNPFEGILQVDTVEPGQVLPVYGSFPIMKLVSGNYYLNAILYNNAGKELAHSSLFFQRMNKNPLRDTTVNTSEFDTTASKDVLVFNIHKTFIAKYEHAQLKAILKMLLPISENAEKQNIYSFLNKPDEMYTRYFIYNFWLSRNPSKPDKEWEKYANQVREVNKIFGSASVPGYETERGYIYLKYGKPNERIIVSTDPDALPYEIWQYFKVSTQGKDGVFLFYKPPQLANDYRLLHSTVTGEARDMNWRNTLFPNGRRENSASKAEEYLRNR